MAVNKETSLGFGPKHLVAFGRSLNDIDEVAQHDIGYVDVMNRLSELYMMLAKDGQAMWDDSDRLLFHCFELGELTLIFQKRILLLNEQE